MIERAPKDVLATDARPVPPAQFLPVALTILLGVGLSIGAFLVVQRHERNRVESEFDWRMRSHSEALRVEISRLEECLYTVRDLFLSSSRVSYDEFATTVSDLRQRHSGIQLMQWLPRVRTKDRAAFEARAQREISPRFEIREWNPDHSAEIRAGDSSEFLPVFYVEPRVGNEDALGLDYLRGVHQRAVTSARNHGRIWATRRVPLPDPVGSEVGWSFFLPLYTNGLEPQTLEERQTRFRGLIQGTFRLSDLVHRSIDASPTGAVEALFLDQSPTSTEPYLIAYAKGAWSTAPPPTEADFQRGLHRVLKLQVGGRDWCVYFRPSAAWLAAQSTPYPLATLAVGLLITGLASFLVHGARRRAGIVAQLVEQRTADLHATQESLREDIRRRELVEQELRRSDDRYRAFVGQSTEAVWRYELDEPIPTDLPVEEQVERYHRGAVLAECNDRMAKMYGFSRSEEIVGTHLSELVPLSDPKNEAHLRAMIENGYRLEDHETREVDREGQQKYFLNNLAGIVENGALRRVWGTQRDITERKRQMEMQLEQDTRLRLAVAAANLGTWDWDLRTNRVIWSSETERMFGLEPGTFDGTLESYLQLLHVEDRERVKLLISRALQVSGEAGTDYELRAIRRDGATRWLVARGAVLRDEQGQAIRMLGTVMDITDQRAAEEERAQIERKLLEAQKLESLGVLAGGIAHDFNNLLTGILGNASLARLDLPANSPAQISLEQIEQVSQRAADLCKQMLAYSGKGRFIVQHLDLSAIVRETADLLRLSISKNAILKFNLVPDLPAINADATQMRQIIMNLVINASEAVGDKSGVITLSTGRLHADRAYLTESYLAPNIPEGEYIFLEVSDNGCGMDAETRAKIFDPFFTTKFTGRGLGLAAVLGIVRGHHGALKVYSEPGRGTNFKLLLPQTDGPAESLAEAANTQSEWRGSGTMLVVDDEETVRRVSARMVEAMGFQVLTAANGHEALDHFLTRGDEITGVLLDLTMPQLDGTATFTELRRIKPEIRVLLMSGFNEQDAVNRFAGKGLAGFIQKPFKPEALRAKLRAIFEPTTPGKASEPFA